MKPQKSEQKAPPGSAGSARNNGIHIQGPCPESLYGSVYMPLVAEVQPLLLHDERMVKNPLVNGQDVLAEQAYEEQLYPSEEKVRIR